eukprot:2659729-Prymnesium_polylepis.1
MHAGAGVPSAGLQEFGLSDAAMLARLNELLLGLDADNVFAYTTTKLIRVRHRWLGVVYYSLLVAIFGYTVGYQIMWKKEYIKQVP